MLSCLHKVLGEKTPVFLQETSLAVVVQVPDAEGAVRRGEELGLRMKAVGKDLLRLGFSGIPLTQIPPGIQALHQAVYQK